MSENDLWACLFGGRKKRNTVDLTGDGAAEDPSNTTHLDDGRQEDPRDLEDSAPTGDFNDSDAVEDPFVIG